MNKIAFLGLGAIGSRMAAHLIAAGHDVTVWNRSPAAVAAAVALGTKSAASPRKAVEGAEFVFSMRTLFGKVPFEPEISLPPNLRVSRDHGDEKRALLYLPADLRIPSIASSQFAAIEPRLV